MRLLYAKLYDARVTSRHHHSQDTITNSRSCTGILGNTATSFTPRDDSRGTPKLLKERFDPFTSTMILETRTTLHHDIQAKEAYISLPRLVIDHINRFHATHVPHLTPRQRLQCLLRRDDLNPNKLGQDLLQYRLVDTVIGRGLDDIVRDNVDVVV